MAGWRAGSCGQVPTAGGSAREQPPAQSAPSCDRSGQGQAALRDVQPGPLRPEPPTPAPTADFMSTGTSCMAGPSPLPQSQALGEEEKQAGVGWRSSHLPLEGGP